LIPIEFGGASTVSLVVCAIVSTGLPTLRSKHSPSEAIIAHLIMDIFLRKLFVCESHGGRHLDNFGIVGHLPSALGHLVNLQYL
jgi:hypothetical protein